MTDPRPRKRLRRSLVVDESSSEEQDAVVIGRQGQDTADGTGAGQKDGDTHTPSQSQSQSPRRKRVVGGTRSGSAGGKKVQGQLTLDAQLSPTNERRTRTRGAASKSPEKLRIGKGTAATGTKSAKNANMRAFFNPASEEQRWHRGPEQKTGNLNSGGGGGVGGGFGWEDEDDSIEDDGVDEIFVGMLGRNTNGGFAEKREAERKCKTSARSIGPGKKFLLPTSHRPPGFGLSTSSSSTVRPAKPWPEEFTPTSLEELAVHKRKVTDVQNWLADVFSGKSRRRILVLRGPAGSGKTTTVSLLSKVLGYDIVEWKNSAGSEYGSQGYVSMGAQFDDFLGRSDKFNTLDLDNEQQDRPAGQGTTENIDAQRRVILVEEFPTSLAPSSSGLLAFRAALQRYLAAAVPPLGIDRRLKRTSPSSSPPIVIVVSETLLGTGSSCADNFTVHRLLGPEISNHPGVSIIEFNPVAPTFISKALDLVLKKEARRSNRKRVPGPAVLKQISEMGDIRSAISSLEFLCLRSADGADWSGTLTMKKRAGKKDIPATAMEKESLEMVTQREASLGIFHAVGKVMYNKREDPAISGIEHPAQPPPHVADHARPKISQVSIDDLINETGTDIQTFISALHENYVLSCTGPTFADTLENCISTLSDADILAPDSRRGYRTSRETGVGSARPSFQSHGGIGSIDVLRQEEICFQTAVRGLLFSLPHPVKRASLPGSRRGDEHKMFYPTSSRLWRETEEAQGLLDLWIRRLTDPNSNPNSNTSKSKPRGVESWRNRFATSMSMSTPDKEDAAAPRAMLSRDQVLLERLPYLRRISTDATDLTLLENLVSFRGIGIVAQSDDPGSELELGLELELDEGMLDSDGFHERRRLGGRRKRGWNNNNRDGDGGAERTSTEMVGDAVEKLVLSDDDIED